MGSGVTFLVLWMFGPSPLLGADLTVHLATSALLNRKIVQYTCDAKAKAIGAPGGTFPVTYINGGGNSLVVVPILGNPTVFVAVISGSGARYVAQQYTWWEAHNAVTFSSDTLGSKVESVCRPHSQH